MGWSAEMTDKSAVGTSITFTPEESTEGGYTVSSFTAPRKGVYRFRLYGSGGTDAAALGGFSMTGEGGKGGYTNGYLLLEKGQTVSVGAGGACSAAFVSTQSTGTSLAGVEKTELLLVAGGGGAGSAIADNANNTGWNCIVMNGGAGGGANGAGATLSFNGTSEDDEDIAGGAGGTQSAGGAAGGLYQTTEGNAGAYGTGGASVTAKYGGYSATSGRGGDGYYGGGSGHAHAYVSDSAGTGGAHGYGGGGGSGYVKTASLTVSSKTYKSSTSQGGGMEAGESGKIIVVYYARALLPVFFDGTQLERLFFNAAEVESLTYNGTLIYMRRLMACLKSMGQRFACRAGTRGLSPSASRA